jgi:hypothetical protein
MLTLRFEEPGLNQADLIETHYQLSMLVPKNVAKHSSSFRVDAEVFGVIRDFRKAKG